MKLQYGYHNSIEVTITSPTTVGAIKNNPNYRASLGYPANVRALIHGVEQPDNAPVGNSDVITLETIANTKGAEETINS